MEAKAIAKTIRVSSQKANLVMRLIRGRTAAESFIILENTNTKSAPLVKKLLNSAVSNATNNHGMLVDQLWVLKAQATEGPTIKRYRARAKGRADSISKRTSHFTIIVTDEKKGTK